MAGRSSRTKGAAGERELFGLLSDHLGFVVRRELSASRDGGCDGLDVPGWAIEVKRTEQALAAHWYQAVYQAEKAGRKPVLFWRRNRAEWRAFVSPQDVAPELFQEGGDALSMSLPRWCELARSQMALAETGR